jgi:hypothetical protein
VAPASRQWRPEYLRHVAQQVGLGLGIFYQFMLFLLVKLVSAKPCAGFVPRLKDIVQAAVQIFDDPSLCASVKCPGLFGPGRCFSSLLQPATAGNK